MNCTAIQVSLSALFDDELSPAEQESVRVHVAGCEDCARFEASITSVRHRLRLESTDRVPDVSAAVTARLHAQPHSEAITRRIRGLLPRNVVRVAAAFVAGVLIGATVIGISRDRPTRLAAADLPERVVAAQRAISSLTAEFTLVERGWQTDVPVRTFHGRVVYEAPESLSLELRDDTRYPSPAWVPNDVALVVRDDTLWTKGPRACPTEAQPDCTPLDPLVEATINREPFATAAPVPLDLITPVESLALAGRPVALPDRRVDGRGALGVVGTAAQFEPLLAGLHPAGNLRELYPLDRVELWLDRQTLVPVMLRVLPTPSRQRSRWADARGYEDDPDTPVLELSVADLEVNTDTERGAFPAPPAAAVRRDPGFHDTPDTAAATGVPDPQWLPTGFTPHRAGRVEGSSEPPIGVRTWTDGRAWVRVDAVTAWPGGRLFGDLGDLVRPVDLPTGGTVHTSEDGSRVAVHGDGVDLVVSGSASPATLLRVAAGLGVTGLPVPTGWDEAATTTLDGAVAHTPGLLVPTGLHGFASPAVRVDGNVVSLSYAGPGTRGFLLTEAPGATLSPPLDPDTFATRVRGGDGRYSPARGELEWIEDGFVLALRSTTLAVEELLAIANGLRSR